MHVKVIVLDEHREEGEFDIEDMDMSVPELKERLAAKFNIPVYLINVSMRGLFFENHKPLTFYRIRENDTLYIMKKKIRYVLKMPSWMTSTAHDHRTLAEYMEIIEGGQQESEDESYDYRRDSFPYAYRGIHYQLVEPGEHPFRKLANAPVPGAPVWTEKTEFWGALRAFLGKHYSKDATEKVVKCFKHELRNYVRSINLDTIEYMAKECLKLQAPPQEVSH